MPLVYIGVGSNIGDKVGYVQQAFKLLSYTKGIKVITYSSLYETEPSGYKDQDWFINAVILVETQKTASSLYKECSRIETQLGRDRTRQAHQWGPRTIDLDILFYDDIIIATDELQVPHARVHERSCTLVPMKEIAPEFVHPVIGKTITQIYNDLIAPEEIYLYGTRTAST